MQLDYETKFYSIPPYNTRMTEDFIFPCIMVWTTTTTNLFIPFMEMVFNSSMHTNSTEWVETFDWKFLTQQEIKNRVLKSWKIISMLFCFQVIFDIHNDLTMFSCDFISMLVVSAEAFFAIFQIRKSKKELQ